MKSSAAARVQKHRDNLRHKGLKLVQIWVPDTRSEGFAEECKRQATLAKMSISEKDTHQLIEQTADFRDWE